MLVMHIKVHDHCVELGSNCTEIRLLLHSKLCDTIHGHNIIVWRKPHSLLD